MFRRKKHWGTSTSGTISELGEIKQLISMLVSKNKCIKFLSSSRNLRPNSIWLLLCKDWLMKKPPERRHNTWFSSEWSLKLISRSFSGDTKAMKIEWSITSEMASFSGQWLCLTLKLKYLNKFFTDSLEIEITR